MITTLTTDGLTVKIPVEVTDDNKDKWAEFVVWISECSIPITVDSNYYKMRYALVEKIRKEIPSEMDFQFLTAEGKEIFLDKHMELMWKI